MNRTEWPLSARLFILSIRVVGSAALILFGLFLAIGPFSPVDLRLSSGQILAWDAFLCLAFCVQHSAMVRNGFKRRAEQVVPPHLGKALYSLASAAMLHALVLLWQESPTIVMQLEGAARWAARAIFVCALPGFVWAATSIPHFDPFGVGPIKDRLRGKGRRSLPFAVRGPYRWVRHPQYFFVLVLVWTYPDLTADRLLFDGILTVWIVLGTMLEERDLVGEFGPEFVEYQRRVPMLFPYRRPWSI